LFGIPICIKNVIQSHSPKNTSETENDGDKEKKERNLVLFFDEKFSDLGNLKSFSEAGLGWGRCLWVFGGVWGIKMKRTRQRLMLSRTMKWKSENEDLWRWEH
jgi:hypothetical protein